jgi:hypothetical protein
MKFCDRPPVAMLAKRTQNSLQAPTEDGAFAEVAILENETIEHAGCFKVGQEIKLARNSPSHEAERSQSSLASEPIPRAHDRFEPHAGESLRPPYKRLP